MLPCIERTRPQDSPSPFTRHAYSGTWSPEAISAWEWERADTTQCVERSDTNTVRRAATLCVVERYCTSSSDTLRLGRRHTSSIASYHSSSLGHRVASRGIRPSWRQGSWSRERWGISRVCMLYARMYLHVQQRARKVLDGVTFEEGAHKTSRIM